MTPENISGSRCAAQIEKRNILLQYCLHLQPHKFGILSVQMVKGSIEDQDWWSHYPCPKHPGKGKGALTAPLCGVIKVVEGQIAKGVFSNTGSDLVLR